MCLNKQYSEYASGLTYEGLRITKFSELRNSEYEGFSI